MGFGGKPQTPYPGFTVSPTRNNPMQVLCIAAAAAMLHRAFGPWAQGPKGNNTIKESANAAPHVIPNQPSHTTRARIMCARARARAPAE